MEILSDISQEAGGDPRFWEISQEAGGDPVLWAISQETGGDHVRHKPEDR